MLVSHHQCEDKRFISVDIVLLLLWSVLQLNIGMYYVPFVAVKDYKGIISLVSIYIHV